MKLLPVECLFTFCSLLQITEVYSSELDKDVFIGAALLSAAAFYFVDDDRKGIALLC